eukprot:CAMPEP_0117741788 /NCGR_PEP_ID=MMETSP0947-20121206/5133_1 /TAXON_ID=44440 /ORGANISM="Chattonella subsalsa, Strain CCMP2191" /LENGTH=205 /DNA_ID=CAMNT_0005558135 /DNA_START=21 /DNA_END=638 /DNA_ORIENTATION=+
MSQPIFKEPMQKPVIEMSRHVCLKIQIENIVHRNLIRPFSRRHIGIPIDKGVAQSNHYSDTEARGYNHGFYPRYLESGLHTMESWESCHGGAMHEDYGNKSPKKRASASDAEFVSPLNLEQRFQEPKKMAEGNSNGVARRQATMRPLPKGYQANPVIFSPREVHHPSLKTNNPSQHTRTQTSSRSISMSSLQSAMSTSKPQKSKK